MTSYTYQVDTSDDGQRWVTAVTGTDESADPPGTAFLILDNWIEDHPGDEGYARVRIWHGTTGTGGGQGGILLTEVQRELEESDEES